jgi:hypothetical protein
MLEDAIRLAAHLNCSYLGLQLLLAHQFCGHAFISLPDQFVRTLKGTSPSDRAAIAYMIGSSSLVIEIIEVCFLLREVSHQCFLLLFFVFSVFFHRPYYYLLLLLLLFFFFFSLKHQKKRDIEGEEIGGLALE